MRIISGTSRGRRLLTPRRQSIRPTSDRVKESIFNILGQKVVDKVVLDLFAGTGNLGIEALSRGAKSVIFVEKGRQALQLIQKNFSQCAMGKRCEIIPLDVNRALGILKLREKSFDIILMDPPYETGLIRKTLLKLNKERIYKEDSILAIEHSRREPLPDGLGGWDLIRQRRIGDTIISLLKPRLSTEG
jgi:16S rRNA (guanine966-N2)-methyltransferase